QVSASAGPSAARAATGGPAAAAVGTASARTERLTRSRTVLEVRGLSKAFGGLHAVSDVSLEVVEGEILGIIGPNGAGKTTLFNLLNGFTAPDIGRVLLFGE